MLAAESPSVKETAVPAQTNAKELVQAKPEEPLLTPDPNRFSLFPIQYHEVGLGWTLLPVQTPDAR
jgi:hypothetical protein